MDDRKEHSLSSVAQVDGHPHIEEHGIIPTFNALSRHITGRPNRLGLGWLDAYLVSGFQREREGGMLNRRQFLGAMGGPAVAAVAAGPFLRDGLPGLLDTLATYPGAPQEIAADEDYWREVQRAFTVDRSIIHLNNGGVSATPGMVQQALHAHQDQAYRVPFYAHRSLLQPQVEAVRQHLARAFGCDAEELALTRNTSEGMAICQLGFPLQPGDEVLTTNQDYPRMLNTWAQRARREGIVVKQIALPVPAEDPAEIVARFEEQMTPRTRLLMLCHMIDLTGQILPVRTVTEMAHARGIPVLVDGAQTFGHLDFTQADLGCDFFATSLHKWLMGPHGTGLLYVRRDRIRDLWPLPSAEPDLEADIRKFEDVGTEEWVRFLVLSEALAFHESIGAARKEARLRYLRDHWLRPLLASDRVHLHTSLRPDCSCALTTIEVDGLDGVALSDYLWDSHRIRVRPIRHEAVTGIRVSPGLHTTLDELDRFVEVMHAVLRQGLPTT